MTKEITKRPIKFYIAQRLFKRENFTFLWTLPLLREKEIISTLIPNQIYCVNLNNIYLPKQYNCYKTFLCHENGFSDISFLLAIEEYLICQNN